MSLIIINGEEEFLKENAAREEARSSLAGEILEFKSVDSYHKYFSIHESEPQVAILFNCDTVPSIYENVDLICVSCPDKPLTSKTAKVILNFPKLKTYNDNNEVIPWIIKEGASLNINLSQIANSLFLTCGSRLRKLSSEIKKLSDLAKCTTLDSESISATVSRSAEITPKNLIDALSSGNIRAAMKYYDLIQEKPGETGWILVSLYHFLENLYYMRCDKDKQMDDQTIAGRHGINYFYYRQYYKPKLNIWSVESLKRSISNVMDLDVLNKQGKGSVEYHLEAEILRLTEEASHVNKRKQQ